MLIFFLLLMLPMFVNAMTYDNAVNIAGNYMSNGDYKYSYEKYIVTSTNSTIYYDEDSDKFIKGGMLSLNEFKITLQNGTKGIYYSYLYEGNPFWTITSSGTKKNVIINNFDAYIKTDTQANIGAKITEYVKKDTKVTGQGTYSEPFLFSPQYKITLKVNNTDRGVLVKSDRTEVGSIEFIATETDYKEIKIKSKGKYGYIGSTCGFVLNDIQANENKLIFTGAKRDTECTINFGEKPVKVTLDQELNNKINSTPKELYVISDSGWYSDAFANYTIPSISTNPERYGYTYGGYYLSTNKDNACTITSKHIHINFGIFPSPLLHLSICLSLCQYLTVLLL